MWWYSHLTCKAQVLAVLLYLAFLNPAPLPPVALSSSSVLAKRFSWWPASKPRVTSDVFVHLLLTEINSWPTGEAAWGWCGGCWRGCRWAGRHLSDSPVAQMPQCFDGHTGWHLDEPTCIADLPLACKDSKVQRWIGISGKNCHWLRIRHLFLFHFFCLVSLLVDSTQQTAGILGYQPIF